LIYFNSKETTDDILYETMIANNRGEHDHSPLIHNNNNGGSEGLL
jgi:hypothetical protein